MPKKLSKTEFFIYKIQSFFIIYSVLLFLGFVIGGIFYGSNLYKLNNPSPSQFGGYVGDGDYSVCNKYIEKMVEFCKEDKKKLDISKEKEKFLTLFLLVIPFGGSTIITPFYWWIAVGQYDSMTIEDEN